MTTREVIDAYYSTSARGDWDGWLALFGDPFLMEDVMGGNISDIETMKEHVDAIRTGYSKFLMSPVHIVVDGEQGFVAWHFQGANASGVPIDAKGSNFFEVNNGKIAHIAEFFNLEPFAPFINQTKPAGN